MIPKIAQIHRSKYGYYLIILAAALSALVHVISKPMLESIDSAPEINPIVMAFLIYFICGIFFTPLTKKTHAISKFGRKDFLFMGLIGIAEVSALITYFFGLTASSAVNASIFSNSEIVFSLIIAILVFKERLRIKECIPFSMIIIGMMVIPVGTDLYHHDFNFGHMVTGDLLIILSGVLYAIDITLCKYISKYDTKRVTQIVSFFCAAVAVSLIIAFQIPMDVNLIQIPSILVVSILGTGMSTLFFLMGLKIIGVVRTVLLYSTTSVFGVLFSGLILSEAITMTDIISLALVLSGIFFLRNKLAEGEETEFEMKNAHSAKSKRRSKSNRSKITPKSVFFDKIVNKIIFRMWIGAG